MPSIDDLDNDERHKTAWWRRWSCSYGLGQLGQHSQTQAENGENAGAVAKSTVNPDSVKTSDRQPRC